MTGIRPFDLLHRAILGGLSTGALIGICWLTLSDQPAWWVPIVAAYAVLVVGEIWLTVRRSRQLQKMRDDYGRPAFGEEL